jgi:hypothetical protein
MCSSNITHYCCTPDPRDQRCSITVTWKRELCRQWIRFVEGLEGRCISNAHVTYWLAIWNSDRLGAAQLAHNDLSTLGVRKKNVMLPNIQAPGSFRNWDTTSEYSLAGHDVVSPANHRSQLPPATLYYITLCHISRSIRVNYQWVSRRLKKVGCHYFT